MLDKIITYSFYLLFFLVPFFWTSSNYELFEYNKMTLTYGLTVIIIGAWLLKIINHKSLIINQTPLDIPLLLFLGASILSTIFSMDPHTSVWGYYSRLNGGLLSIISYLLLYWAFVSNMDFAKIKTLLKFGLTAGFIISLWAILEHFGVSFSCVLLRGDFNASCWIQDVQARVFATLGQPNWLAAYLSMLIFPALYFFLTANTQRQRITYFLSLIAMYLAFTFTYSRGPTLGLIGGMIIFFILFSLSSRRRAGSKSELKLSNWIPAFAGMTKPILILLSSFLVINLLFGSALTSFRLVSKFAAPVRPGINLPTGKAAPVTSGTQLENGGTESGQIRLIVWKGALDIFKHNPVLGSGLETFAYSYYQYRPQEHNLTSEWDFLYNKAHNEYLNYLATTGIVGFGTYMLVILAFVVFCLKIFNKNFKLFQKKLPSAEQISNSDKNNRQTLFVAAIAASYVSYLIYNFFLFSVVIIAVFFYLFPALAFVTTNSIRPLQLPKFLIHNSRFIIQFIYRRPFYTKAAKGIVIISIIYLLYSILQLWYADTIFAQGQRASDAGNPGRAYNLLSAAVDLNKGEPFYKSELAFAAASAAVSLRDSDATLSAALKDEAVDQTNQALKISPNNVSLLRTAIRTYFELSFLDKPLDLPGDYFPSEKKNYVEKTLQTVDLAIKFAPTDPKLYYNKALILDSLNRKNEELKALQEAVKLKPNYLEALTQLKEATASGDKK